MGKTIKRMAREAVLGLSTREEIEDMAATGVRDTYWGDWAIGTEWEHADSPGLRAAMQTAAVELLAERDALGTYPSLGEAEAAADLSENGQDVQP